MPRFPPSRLVRRLPASRRHIRARLRVRAGIAQPLTIVPCADLRWHDRYVARLTLQSHWAMPVRSNTEQDRSKPCSPDSRCAFSASMPTTAPSTSIAKWRGCSTICRWNSPNPGRATPTTAAWPKPRTAPSSANIWVTPHPATLRHRGQCLLHRASQPLPRFPSALSIRRGDHRPQGQDPQALPTTLGHDPVRETGHPR